MDLIWLSKVLLKTVWGCSCWLQNIPSAYFSVDPALLRGNEVTRRPVSKAARLLVGLFYFLQGLGNLVLAFFIRVDVSYGGSGGAAAGMEIMIKSSLVLASLLSFGFILVLYLEFETLTLLSGLLSSLVFGLFYGFLGLLLPRVIVQHFSLMTVFYFVVSVSLAFLNLIAAVFVIRIVSDMR